MSKNPRPRRHPEANNWDSKKAGTFLKQFLFMYFETGGVIEPKGIYRSDEDEVRDT